MIAIIDYGLGNLRSVQKAFEKVGAQALVTDRITHIADAHQIVLPGVGAMQPAMTKLVEKGLVEVILNSIKSGKPFLGICLGLQLLFERSTEGGDVKGLGILPGSVEKFTGLKVPHMGWNQLKMKHANSRLFKNIPNNSNVYFCHSYFVKPVATTISATVTHYGGDFTSAIETNNISGVQFHPEKSQQWGLKILKNFAESVS